MSPITFAVDMVGVDLFRSGVDLESKSLLSYKGVPGDIFVFHASICLCAHTLFN